MKKFDIFFTFLANDKEIVIPHKKNPVEAESIGELIEQLALVSKDINDALVEVVAIKIERNCS